MNDVDRIFEIIGDEDYNDIISFGIISCGLVIEFDENLIHRRIELFLEDENE